MTLRALAVSDQIDPRLHSATLRDRMPDVRMVFGCGDIPARYLEFLADALDQPVYFVLGNHLEELTRHADGVKRYEPMGCIDLGGKILRDKGTGLIMAGLPGSPKYCDCGQEQYTEFQMMWMVIKMAPKMFWNKLRFGRTVDILISHAPPRDVNDRDDPPHRGFRAIRRFHRWYKPAYHLHGHVHLYDRNEPNTAQFEQTTVINVYPYQVLDLDPASVRAGMTSPIPSH